MLKIAESSSEKLTLSLYFLPYPSLIQEHCNKWWTFCSLILAEYTFTSRCEKTRVAICARSSYGATKCRWGGQKGKWISTARSVPRSDARPYMLGHFTDHYRLFNPVLHGILRIISRGPTTRPAANNIYIYIQT